MEMVKYAGSSPGRADLIIDSPTLHVVSYPNSKSPFSRYVGDRSTVSDTEKKQNRQVHSLPPTTASYEEV